MAISAMLMLSTGIAQAQDAVQPTTAQPAPDISANPSPAAPTVATPTIVLPTLAAETPVTAPVGSTPEPAVATTAPPAARSPAPPASTPATRSVRREAVNATAATGAAVVPARTAATAPTGTVAANIPAPVAAPPAAAAVAAPAEVANDDGLSPWALPVGAAATLLVLGGVALGATRRRRTWQADATFVPSVVHRPAVHPAAEPTIKPVAPTFMRAPMVTATMQDREWLIERMVAAAPDAANPFTSRKARRRRARLIVGSAPAPAAARPDTAPQATAAQRPMQDQRVLETV